MDDVDEDQEMTGFRFPPEPIAGPLQSGSLSKYGLDDLDSDAVSEEDEAVDDTLEEARRLRLEDSMLDMEDPSFMPPDENSQSDVEMSDDDDIDRDESDLVDEMGMPIRRRGRYGRFSQESPPYGSKRAKGVKRGPRKPVEPSPEFKELHSAATLAFIDSDYDRAVTLVKQAIQINPEIFAAHALLSEVFLAQGLKDKALAALFSGAHTRHRDGGVWLKVAQLIRERGGDNDQDMLRDLIYCYNRVVEVEPQNYDARFRRATAHRELGHYGKAALEYDRLLNDYPHNLDALRQLAESCIDLKDVSKALERYEESIPYYTEFDPGESNEFSWSDINIYTDLLGFKKEYMDGILALRSLARWLLGRKDDTNWDIVKDDDREWDADHSPRRISTPWFREGLYSLESYGQGLPLELRVKLGTFRLKLSADYREEALYHFEWLEPHDTTPSGKLFDYGDLFREAADALKDAGLHGEALRFYCALQYSQEYADTSLYMALGQCYEACQNEEGMESSYLTVAEYDRKNLDVRVKLATFYERMGMANQAMKWISEAGELARSDSMPKKKRRNALGARVAQVAKEFRAAESEGRTREERTERRATLVPAITGPVSFTKTRDRGPEAGGQERRTRQQDTHDIQYLYGKMLELQPAMRAGDEDATEDWLDIADALIRDFRANRVFFPLQRSMGFLGYSREAQRKAGKLRTTTLIDQIQDISDRLQSTLGRPEEVEPPSIPTDYHGISFDDWLDIILEYALILASQGQADEVYDTLGAAADSSVWFRSKESAFQIHVCWFTCAIRLDDEDTLLNIARWFMKEYQFVTEAYHLFSIASYFSGDRRKSLFHSAPSQKFLLRHVKAIDFTIPQDSDSTVQRPSDFRQERPILTTKDERGEPIPAEEMDVALLALYGHLLYTGNSFTNALNYLFRAYALDPNNPVILLSIGLSYIHNSLKRQAENRHYMILQGLSFMQEYRLVRERSSVPQERQEMEFNFARVYQLLGLGHLAVQGYEKCLAIGEEIEALSQRQGQNGSQKGDGSSHAGQSSEPESFTREAAYALQTVYALSGELGMAKQVTERWLVL